LLDLQTEQHSLEARLSTPLSAKEVSEVGRRLTQIAGELGNLEEQWLAISAQIDTAVQPIPS
jgi:hypothetical protein